MFIVNDGCRGEAAPPRATHGSFDAAIYRLHLRSARVERLQMRQRALPPPARWSCSMIFSTSPKPSAAAPRKQSMAKPG